MESYNRFEFFDNQQSDSITSQHYYLYFNSNKNWFITHCKRHNDFNC